MEESLKSARAVYRLLQIIVLFLIVINTVAPLYIDKELSEYELMLQFLRTTTDDKWFEKIKNPELKDRFRYLADISAKKAEDEIKKSIKGKKKEIKFQGVPLDTRIAKYFASLLTCIMSVYLFVIIRHVLRMVSEHKNEVCQFPVLIFFPDHMSMFLSFLSLVILPPFANLHLKTFLGNWGFAVIFAVCLINILNFVEARKVSKIAYEDKK